MKWCGPTPTGSSTNLRLFWISPRQALWRVHPSQLTRLRNTCTGFFYRSAARKVLLGLGATIIVVAIAPGRAMAHGIGGALDLPVTLHYFVIGVVFILVVFFVALARLWPEPRFQDGPRYEGSGRSVHTRPILAAAGVVSLLLVIGQIVPAIFGLDRDPTRPTIAPVLVWVVFWLVVPFASPLIGSWYTDINPWRSLVRRDDMDKTHSLRRPGVWPAAIIFVAFAWFGLVSPDSGDPVTLGAAALAYTVFLAMVVAFAGREHGLASFDAFTPYNRLFSAISPLGRSEGGKLVWRGWFRALTVIPEWPGLWIFVVAMIGTVAYDGASGTDWFDDVTFGLLGSIGGQTALLVLSVVVVSIGFWLASFVTAKLTNSSVTTTKVTQRFAHSLVPVALAYAVAHYFTLIIFEGQQLFAAISDPFGLGWDLFGTADRRVDFFIVSSEPIWYFQVASIVGGSLLGIALAHDRALADFGGEAVRPRYAMLVLMVGLAALGLTILAG